MKKYISKPQEQLEVSAIQISEENRTEIENIFSNVVLRFFYHNENKMAHFHKECKDEEHNKLGCFLLINDAHCAAFNGDYIIILKDGRVTAREKEVFEKEFEII